MAEFCKNGHELTEENSLWHKDSGRNRLRRRCRECKNGSRRSGKPDAAAMSVQRTTELHEDVEDMIRFGATFQEIVQRSGFKNWTQLRESLNRRGRVDLLEKLRTKRGDVYQTQLSGSVIPGKPSNTKLFGASERGQWIMENL